MGFPLYPFTSWCVGLINGYKHRENGLPNDIKYGTIGITSFMEGIKIMAKLDKPLLAATTPMQKGFIFFILTPFIVSSNFCVGHHMGKAIRYGEDGPIRSRMV